MKLKSPYRYLIQFGFEYRFANLIQSGVTELKDIVDGFHGRKIGKIQKFELIWEGKTDS
jgi:hypothetical protein